MKGPKMPAAPAAPPPPPGPPTVDQAQANVDATDQLRRRRGRAADILAPVSTPASALSTGGVKTLTG